MLFRSFPDVMENLGARLIGWDAGISLAAGADRNAMRETPLFRRAAGILRTCEELRHAQRFDNATKTRLREPGREFALAQDADGQWQFLRSASHAQVIDATAPWTTAWTVTNGFNPQPARFRIEALMAAGPTTNVPPLTLADLATATGEGWTTASADGVASHVRPGTGDDTWGTLLTATNSARVPRNAAWTRWERRFATPLDLSRRQGLEVELAGDGSGALLAIRLESPRHLAYGALADRYDPRRLLVAYYGLRGLSLIVLPYCNFGPGSLGVFAVFYGLDWIATVPPTVALATRTFGAREAPIVQVADAISAARPGARGDQAESHLRRLEDLQAIAMGFDGVERAYAVQAGREVRILVRPDQIDDEGARNIAREVVARIEEQLSYPGQIRVTVIRESRAVDYAR